MRDNNPQMHGEFFFRKIIKKKYKFICFISLCFVSLCNKTNKYNYEKVINGINGIDVVYFVPKRRN